MKLVDWCWLIFGALVLLVVVGLAWGQSSALCNDGMCVIPEKALMDLMYYLQYLEKLTKGQCA